MLAILVNGSPHPKGCTYTALTLAEEVLNKEGIRTQIFSLDTTPISGCRGCGGCAGKNRCVTDDCVNRFLELAEQADGFLFGTPVHFAAASGALTSFMDRAFYGRGAIFGGKPAAAVVSCRRGGASAALDQVNKYFGICNMPTVPSRYWNMVHGTTPEEVLQDEEGVQTMRTLGQNLAWMMKCFDLGKKNGIAFRDDAQKIRTNFIR